MESVTERIESYVQRVQNMSTFGAAFLYDVGKLVQSLGYTMTDGDDWLLGFATQKIEQEIRNSCNVCQVPIGLFKVAAGLIVSEFLQMKRGCGALTPDALTFEPALKQLQEGDTNMVFDTEHGLNAEQKLDLFISHMEQGRNQFITFRRLKW